VADGEGEEGDVGAVEGEDDGGVGDGVVGSSREF
jgi:hypothetical protein